MIHTQDKRAIIVTDLGYGDAGKGTIVDFLTCQYNAHTVIRFNGGAQAAHNVVTPDGRWHTFSQFGAGTFVPGVRSYFSRHTLIDPFALQNEAQHLINIGVTDCFNRLYIDRNALVITPYQQVANRLKELARGENRHGSCGMGIGETMSDALKDPDLALRMGDIVGFASHHTRRKLQRIRDAKWTELASFLPMLPSTPEAQAYAAMFTHESPHEITNILSDFEHITRQVHIVDESALHDWLGEPGCAIFEGAQGMLLDQDYGFPPYNTWSNTTFANALDLLHEADYQGDVHKLGVLRTYFTRHGAGCFVTEAPELAPLLPEAHNTNSTYQQHFRVGWFDAVAARYALGVCGGIDSLALTHMDRLTDLPVYQWCDAYSLDGSPYDLVPAPAPVDQAVQALVTRDLFRVTSHYQTVSPQPATVIETLENALNVRVSVTSYGMTARDKRISPFLHNPLHP